MQSTPDRNLAAARARAHKPRSLLSGVLFLLIAGSIVYFGLELLPAFIHWLYGIAALLAPREAIP